MQKRVVPMFHVPDVRRTIEWYRDVGFEVTTTYGNGVDGLSFAMVSFGGGEVMFSSGGQLSSKHRREVDLYAYVEDVDSLYDRIKDRIEIVEGPHNMFYGMREVIVRDLNGFWITFGHEVPAEVLTPWPAVDADRCQPYTGRYESDTGSAVLITIHQGRGADDVLDVRAGWQGRTLCPRALTAHQACAPLSAGEPETLAGVGG